MSAAESIAAEAARGVVMAEHLLICRDIARVMGPKALAGDPHAIEIVHQAAEHVRRFGLNSCDQRRR
ncbi:hypothetical protein [Nocardia brasiliensis]|uniref:hypothetical protein n=1 Tax=Nocardia brasiliensis TaxID=37326 RepID=UPI0004A6AC85|nr:hypothetical protein [Nocardia brasiliensis]